MHERYRVIVWGPGTVGSAVLKTLYGRPEFEIVGVLCHSPSKVGVDVGTYIGRDAIGVIMSDDRTAVFGLDADVVIYTGMIPINHDQMDEDILALLASGKNVISASAYWYPPLMGPDYVAKIEEACRCGNTSLHGSGELPGLFLDRIALAMTGACMTVEHLKLEEWFDISGIPPQLMGVFGFGQAPDDAAKAAPMFEPILLRAYSEEITKMAHAMFSETPVVTVATHFVTGDQDIALATSTIAAGTVSGVTFTFNGRIGDQTRFTVILNWSLDKPEKWLIEIEGDPVSLRSEISAFASLKGELRKRPGDDTGPGHYAAAVPLVQAIPIVCEAAPGIVYPSAFTHTTSDYRSLGTRKSIVG